jgi:imidazolonepropionase-like amidohydrolase
MASTSSSSSAVVAASLGTTLCVSMVGSSTLAQAPPPADLHPSRDEVWAIVGAEVVIRPGERLSEAVIVMRDGVIEAVGSVDEVAPPAGARVIDASGLVAYPGLVEIHLEIDAADAAGVAAREGGAHWNTKIVPQLDAARLALPDDATRRGLRELGFTTAAVHPNRGILRGSTAAWSLDESTPRRLGGRPMMVAAFEHGGSWDRATYPGAFVGSVALFRQTLQDAAWHAECLDAWRSGPEGLEMPMAATALEALAPVVAGDMPIYLQTDSEFELLEAVELAAEFDVPLIVGGSGNEFRRLGEVAAAGVPVVVPLDFPEAPKADSPWEASELTLRELLAWEQAPTNPRRLLDAGVEVALTSHGLDRRSDLVQRIRDTYEAGLDEDLVLAALTITPAKLLGIEAMVGTLEPGKQADLVLVDGDLFGKDRTIREVWIGGNRHRIETPPVFALSGEATLTLPDGKTHRMSIDPTSGKIEIVPSQPQEAAAASSEPAEDSEVPGEEGPTQPASPAEAKPVRASGVRFVGDTVSFRLSGKAFDRDGTLRVAATLIDGVLYGTAEADDGELIRFTAMAEEKAPTGQSAVDPAAPEAGEDAVAVAAETPDDANASGADDAIASADADGETPLWERPLPVPFGAFGRMEKAAPERVLFRGATLWTCGPEGVIENGDLLIDDGKIAYAGPRREFRLESDLRVVEVGGRHITPGLIDCHSHTGLFGGVNEATSNATAEVRMADALDPDDINWYRQLAGGLTVANQLHGSANPIGGQSSVVKLRWGDSRAAMRFDTATPGIKFALGENVVRPRNRYPETRMGVAAFLDDRFDAARRWRSEQDEYAALDDETRSGTMPPRPDLQLETLAEILAGERLIHCHSYRQDEILMLLRLAERHGFTIGTLQHVLEGYKIADVIAEHGAGASSFSDWWAYKMEVMDAVADNGAIMDRVGVLVSFNSDSDEHARRMNTEAAKAMRHGDLSPERALALVTINPAKQLGVADRVGSLEGGKDADFAIWTAPPLSAMARCEETWIDGIRRFSVDEDVELAAFAEGERRRLLAKALDGDSSRGGRGGEGRGRPAADGFRARGMLGRMLLEQEEAMLEFARRGLDPTQSVQGGCGLEWAGEGAR